MQNKINLGIIGKNFGYKVIYQSFLKNKKFKIVGFSFKKKVESFLNKSSSSKIDFISEPKIDGLSLNLYYKKGKLASATTSGDGSIGENVINNIYT